MATKKTTTKKAPASKKLSTVRKSTPKKTARKKSNFSAASVITSRVRLEREDTAFFTFRITRQTLYWLILGAVVLLFTVWLTQLQSDIQDLYDQIDASTAEMSAL